MAYAKFKTKMLMSQIKETEDDSEPQTPAERPRNASKAAKAQSMKVSKRPSVLKQQQLAQSQASTSRAGKMLPKGISMDPVGSITVPDSGTLEKSSGSAKGSMDIATPILRAVHQEIQKQRESREGSLKEKSAASTPAPRRTSAVKEEASVESEEKQEAVPSCSERKLSSAKKTEFTVVQIETRRHSKQEAEEEEKCKTPSPDKEPVASTSGSSEKPSKPARKKSTPKDDDGGGSSKKVEEVTVIQSTSSQSAAKRKESVTSVSSVQDAPGGVPRSPSPKGKSAVTGQTRTGWI